jgi:hypothetical protein
MHDVSPTTDDRPFFFHTTKIRDQFQTAFGRSMLFGNGLSALMTLMAISGTFVALFVVGPLFLSSASYAAAGPDGSPTSACSAQGFMLIEVALLQRFVLLLGHPVYSLTVTLFSVLLGTGIGSIASRYFDPAKLQRTTQLAILGVVGVAILGVVALPSIIRTAITAGHEARIALTVLMILPAGIPDGHSASGRRPAHVSSPRGARSMGLGHERRPVGDWRHAGRLRRDELGFLGHSPGRRRGLSGRRYTSAQNCR